MLLLSSHSTEKGSHYLMILLHEETSRQSLLTNPVLHNNMCIPQHGTLRSQCRQRWCGDKVGFANTLLNLDEYKIFNYYSPPPNYDVEKRNSLTSLVHGHWFHCQRVFQIWLTKLTATTLIWQNSTSPCHWPHHHPPLLPQTQYQHVPRCCRWPLLPSHALLDVEWLRSDITSLEGSDWQSSEQNALSCQ